MASGGGGGLDVFVFSPRARRLGPGDASVASARGGVTASSHKRERSAVDLAALLLCHFAASTNTYLAPVALAATSFFSSACGPRGGGGGGVGFPRGDDSLLRRVSHPLATLAGVVFRVSAHVVLFAASFATFARDVGGAAERWNARDALRGRSRRRRSRQFAALSSAGGAAAQATQERRAARAVRERVIKMATSAEV